MEFENDNYVSLFGLSQGWTFSIYVTLILFARVFVLKTLMTLSRSRLADETRITRKPAITAKQLKRESVWPLGFVIDWVLSLAFYHWFNLFVDMPLINPLGFLYQLLIHVTLIEFVYYWWHRVLHWKFVYKFWHQYHHASINTEPTTSYSFEIGERLSYTILFAVTPVLTEFLGYQSYATFAFQLLWFDVNNGGGHINFEMFPRWFMDSWLALIWYTPSYHSIHHTRFKYNFSLFMPWPDVLFSTTDWPHTREVFHRAVDGLNKGTAMATTPAAESEAAQHNHMTQIPEDNPPTVTATGDSV